MRRNKKGSLYNQAVMQRLTQILFLPGDDGPNIDFTIAHLMGHRRKAGIHRNDTEIVRIRLLYQLGDLLL